MDDGEILARVRAGAVDEFGELVARHQSHIFRVLYRYERDPQKLEDLCQETFLKAWRALHQFDGRAPFQHWLTRIAVRAALDHLRKERRRRSEVELSDLGEDALQWLTDDKEDCELQGRQAAELLGLAMKELSPAEQIVLTLQAIEGRSVKEIAALTGSSGVAVRVRALRARAKLRRCLQRLENEQRGSERTTQVRNE